MAIRKSGKSAIKPNTAQQALIENASNAAQYTIEVTAEHAVNVAIEQTDGETEKTVNIYAQLGAVDWRQTERTVEALHMIVAAAASTTRDRVKFNDGFQLTTDKIRPRANFSIPQADPAATRIFETRLAKGVELFVSGKFADKDEVSKDPELTAAVRNARRLVKVTKLQSRFNLQLCTGRMISVSDTLNGAEEQIEVIDEVIFDILYNGCFYSKHILHLITPEGKDYDFSFDEHKLSERIEQVCKRKWQEIRVKGIKKIVDGKDAGYTLTGLESVGELLATPMKTVGGEIPQNPEQ